MSDVKKKEGADKKAGRTTAIATLTALFGKTFSGMTKTEQENFITAIAQLSGLMDASGKVKATK